MAFFDNDKISATAVIDSIPVDVTEGLNFDGDFFKSEKTITEQSNIRKGLQDASYRSVASSDTQRDFELDWIPGSPAIKILTQAMKAKKTVKWIIKNDSDPKFLFTAEDCTFREEPEIVINGKTGFKNSMFKFRSSTSEYNYL